MWARVIRLVAIIAVSMFLGYLIGTMQTGSAILHEPQAQSPFLVSDLSIEPKVVRPGEAVTIMVTVTNRHYTWGIYSLILQLNGKRVEEKQANLVAGGTQEVSFLVTRDDPGRYQVFINGLSGSFEVVGKAVTAREY